MLFTVLKLTYISIYGCIMKYKSLITLELCFLNKKGIKKFCNGVKYYYFATLNQKNNI